MIKEVPLYHQMNGGIHMNQLVTGKFMSSHEKEKRSKSSREKSQLMNWF